MRSVTVLVLTTLFAGLSTIGSATAQDAVIVGNNPSECEVAAALGVTKAGCPTLTGRTAAPARTIGTRGLAIGTIDQMPEPPEPPAATATVAPAPAKPPAPTPRQEYKASFQINFEFASAQLTADAHHVLDLVGAAMTAPDAASARFRIIGHTDSVGTDQRNLHLSQQRADAVRTYLTSHYQIDPARIETAGRGARELRNRADPTAAENRRVVISNLGN